MWGVGGVGWVDFFTGESVIVDYGHIFRPKAMI